jgi:DNA-directed RNA polymerase specialized sigma24 family protein
VTYCVLGAVGLDVGGESIPYVAGWGEDGALDALRKYTRTIDVIARRIEDALVPAAEWSTDGTPRRHHRDLQRAVARAVNASSELIEDACQNAWVIMLRRQPDRQSAFAWLYVVATREALRLCRRERRQLHREALVLSGACEAAIADTRSIDDVLQAREALALLAGLPDRQRTDLALLVAGFTYAEIAELTTGRTYTNVISGGACRCR